MSLFSFRDSADALDDLLDRERSAILAGKFDILGRLLKEKERLVVAVGTPASAHRLGPLKIKVDRNQAMLLAASRGIKAVSDRLTSRALQSETFQTYDRSGQRHGQTSGPHSLERRA